MLENWGYKSLLLERMLYLDGSPNMSELFPLQIGQSVKAQLEHDLAIELEAVPMLTRAIKAAVEAGDDITRGLLEKLLVDAEHRVDWLEAQLHIIAEIGVENYLAQQPHE